MINVIVFGTGENAHLINAHLLDGYKINAFIELEDNYISSSFNSIKVYKESEYSYCENDYVIVAYNTSINIQRSIEILRNKKVPDDKIIVFNNINHFDYSNPLYLFQQNARHYDTLLFGMSHSQNGLIFERFGNNVFPIVSPSCDLFYYKNALKILLNSEMNNLKRIVFELPYYIFNYDLSRQKHYVFNRMQYFESINDYHNFDNTCFINSFKTANNLFDFQKLINKSFMERNCCLESEKTPKTFIKKILNHANIAFSIDKVWSNIYQTTIDENTSFFSQIISLIYEKNPNIEVMVIVMPMNPIFKFWHSQKIKNQKKIFYRCLQPFSKLKICDFFDSRIASKYFIDYCHLSFDGKKMMDALISKNKQQDLYYANKEN